MPVLVALAMGAAIGATAAWVLSRRSMRRDVAEVAASVGLEQCRPFDITLSQLGRLARDGGDVGRTALAERDLMVAAIERVTQGVVVVNSSGEIVFANEVAAPYLGGRHGDAIVADAVRELSERAVTDGRSHRDIELFGPPMRSLVVTASALEEGAVVLIDDVTEVHRVDAVRRDFVANVSHELKTPVAAMSLLAETMIDEDDPQTLQQLATTAHLEAQRVGRIIEDLLDLSRLESKKSLDDNRVSVLVSELIDEAVERVDDFAQSRRVRVKTAATEVVANLDRTQIVSALRNLIENAVKYSPEKSTVDVRVANHGGDLCIAVEDQGIGVPEHDLERIFERFYRVDRGRSRASGGTGLGLAIVNHVAANHGGTVQVVSREGVGSTFTLVLPDVIVDETAAANATNGPT